MTIASLGQEALGGLAAGIVGTVIGYPLDVVKSRQAFYGRSMVATAGDVYRQAGVGGFYRGMMPPLLSLSVLNTLNFTAYSYFQGVYRHIGFGSDDHSSWKVRHSLAGASCGPLAAAVSTVENLVKTQVHMHRYRTSLDCVRDVWQSDRWRLLYTGHAVNTAREMTFLATYFGVYEGLRGTLVIGYDQHHSSAIPLAGGAAGAVAWAVSFPLDCVRAGVQGQDLTRGVQQTARRVFETLLQERGLAGLYAGVAPSIVRAFLVSATRFSAYETALWMLHVERRNSSR